MLTGRPAGTLIPSDQAGCTLLLGWHGGADGREMAALGEAEDEGMRGGCCGKVSRP